MLLQNLTTLATTLLTTTPQGITDTGFISGLASIAAAIALFPGIAVAMAQGRIGAEAVAAVGRQPEAKDEIRQIMIVSLGMSETAALYGLLIAFLLIFAT